MKGYIFYLVGFCLVSGAPLFAEPLKATIYLLATSTRYKKLDEGSAEKIKTIVARVFPEFAEKVEFLEYRAAPSPAPNALTVFVHDKSSQSLGPVVALSAELIALPQDQLAVALIRHLNFAKRPIDFKVVLDQAIWTRSTPNILNHIVYREIEMISSRLQKARIAPYGESRALDALELIRSEVLSIDFPKIERSRFSFAYRAFLQRVLEVHRRPTGSVRPVPVKIIPNRDEKPHPHDMAIFRRRCGYQLGRMGLTPHLP